jgi:hypothetical protein
MRKRIRWAFAGTALVAAMLTAGVLVATGSATGGPGGNDGSSATGPSNGMNCPTSSGGSLTANGITVTDQSSGQTYNVQLQAMENGASCQGQMVFQLYGPSINACDVHGPSMDPGTTPLTSVQCGGSFGVTVMIHGCQADVETHGLVHADNPWTVYLGPMTLDVSFKYNPQQASGKLTIAIYTPKTVLSISGPTSGPVAMPTCT